jgi:hypothetical protein
MVREMKKGRRMNDDPLHEFSFQDFEAAAVIRGRRKHGYRGKISSSRRSAATAM